MTTIDDSLSKVRSVRNDIWRCRKLLQTELADAEREIVEKRLNEQLSAFEELLTSTFPLGLALKQFGDRLEETVSTERENLIGDINGKDTSACNHDRKGKSGREEKRCGQEPH